jgi:antitoxin (DNA-binding transcriptional repressor) of toxin-antitoxin stability system
MINASIEDAKKNLQSQIAQIERRGEKIIIERHGKAVAVICPVGKQSRIIADPILKSVVIKCDSVSSTQTKWENVFLGKKYFGQLSTNHV